MLYRGSLSVEAEGVKLTMLTDGAFFGERALLALIDGATNATRTASCIAVTYSDICCITLADFSGICEEHPEVLQALKQESATLPGKQKKQTSEKVLRGLTKLARRPSMLNLAEVIGVSGIAPSHEAVRAGALEASTLHAPPGSSSAARRTPSPRHSSVANLNQQNAIVPSIE